MYDEILLQVKSEILRYKKEAIKIYGIPCEVCFCDNKSIGALSVVGEKKLMFDNAYLLDLATEYLIKSYDFSLFYDDSVKDWLQERIAELNTVESIALMLFSHEYAHLLDYRTHPSNIHLLIDEHDKVFIKLWTGVYNKLKGD
jgi:hypothetical protein